jgi:ubiquinone/menaquinone biosynthesis C-methylase UbiE
LFSAEEELFLRREPEMSETQDKQPYFGQKPANAYVIDAESTAEMGRLMRLDEVLTECMGGLFPEHPDLTAVRDTLDVACGPGAWASEMAYTYPQMQVTGIDISEIMIRYAQEMARVQRLENAHFQVMDATKPLAFPDNSFDLVNARLITGFMRKEDWPGALQELVRITRPGGVIRLTETNDWGISTSGAHEHLTHLFARACYVTGRSFSAYANAHHVGTTLMLEPLYRQAGLEEIHKKAHVLDFSVGTRAYHSTYENLKVAFKLLQPFIVQAGVASQEELDLL